MTTLFEIYSDNVIEHPDLYILSKSNVGLWQQLKHPKLKPFFLAWNVMEFHKVTQNIQKK